MVPNDFMDNEIKKFFGKIWVQMRVFGQAAQACNLLCLTRWVRRRKVMAGFKRANSFGAAEAFRQHGNKRCVNIVYAAAEVLQGFRGARLVCHGVLSL
ncbi:hypothetical protein AA18895_2055 [Acetobacter ghanensis DSM 18895]|nr:hypothetical protein AA18895_2055 [Acetobacter ghanensis DSM 18895]